MSDVNDKRGFKYHWEENVKPIFFFFIVGFFVSCGIIAADWMIPKKPIEYRICIQDAGGDYMCEVYK